MQDGGSGGALVFQPSLEALNSLYIKSLLTQIIQSWRSNPQGKL